MLPSHAERLLRHVPQVTPGFRASVDLDLGNQRVHVEEPGALPKTNIAPKTVVSSRNPLFQESIFRCYVSFREGT